MNTRRILVSAGLSVALILSATASSCADDYNDDRGKGDAPTDSKDDSPKDVINFPNGFSNVAHGCDGHGHRVYVTTQNESGKELVVIDDASCSGDAG